MTLLVRALLFLVSTNFMPSSSLDCENHSYLYKIPGDVMIAAIIGAHSGEECSVVEYNGLQLIQSIITAVDSVRMNNLLPGINIGLLVYDSCSQEGMTQKSIISALVDTECNDGYFLGVLLEEGGERHVKNITTNLGVYVQTISRNMSAEMRASIAIRSLYEMEWMPIDKLISTDENITTEFLKLASSFGICVKQILPFSEIAKVEPTDTITVFSNYVNMKEVSETLSGGRLLFIPLDNTYLSTDFKFSKIMVLMPSTVVNPTLLNPFNVTEVILDAEIQDILLKTRSKSSLQELQVTNDILKMIGSLKRHIKLYCTVDGQWSLCSNLPKLSHTITGSDLITNIRSIKEKLKFLRIEEDEFEAAMILHQNSQLQNIGSLRISEQDWTADVAVNITGEVKTCKPKPVNNSLGIDCLECANYNLIYKEFFEHQFHFFATVELKQEAWVAALLSISTVGILCCIAIAIFIVVRICKKDMLEGNPGFSFLLLISIMFMFASILPYSFEVVDNHHYYKGIFCGLKIFGTSLSYSLVFSIMLARSFMLASCDEDGGFMSHVNGYLQTVLCFFIAAVQIALTLQFWAINWLLLSQQQCVAMSKGSLFLFLLGYDMFLLLLLISISPFTFKSKRNYHEGSYFAACTYICFVVWLAWCTGYIFLPQWEDIFVCFGLVGTATVILVSVFIPRTYLMLTGIVRDHIVSTLPSLNHTTSTSVVDVHYRSTQALYDSVIIPQANTTSNYYAERPTTPSTSKMEDDRVDNTYERYDRSPSPRNITRF